MKGVFEVGNIFATFKVKVLTLSCLPFFHVIARRFIDCNNYAKKSILSPIELTNEANATTLVLVKINRFVLNTMLQTS